MTIRWPDSLPPVSCTFGRTRNPVVHSSMASRQMFVSQRARPLWTCSASWELLPEQVPEFRLIMEAMDGMVGQRMIWDFANWSTTLSPPSVTTFYDWKKAAIKYKWDRAGTKYRWKRSTPTYSDFSGTMVAGPAAAGATLIPLTGLPRSTLFIEQGRYVQLGEHLYIILASVNSTSAGIANIQITTPLVEDLTLGDTIRFEQCACPMRMTASDWSQSNRWDGQFTTASAKFLEVA